RNMAQGNERDSGQRPSDPAHEGVRLQPGRDGRVRAAALGGRCDCGFGNFMDWDARTELNPALACDFKEASTPKNIFMLEVLNLPGGSRHIFRLAHYQKNHRTLPYPFNVLQTLAIAE